MPYATTTATLCALLVFALAPPARAQERAAEDERVQAGNREKRDDEARSLFVAGKSAFEDGRFEDALVEFKRSHARSGRPELLYNVGLAAMELGRDQEALEALQAFLSALPDARTAEAARLRVELLKARMAPQPTTDAAATAGLAAPSSDREPRRVARPFTWVAGGIGVALAASALGVGIKASRDYDDLRRECRSAGEGTCSRARVDDSGLDHRALATNLLIAGAGSALAAGLVLYFYEGRDRADIALTARVGPNSVSLLGSF